MNALGALGSALGDAQEPAAVQTLFNSVVRPDPPFGSAGMFEYTYIPGPAGSQS